MLLKQVRLVTAGSHYMSNASHICMFTPCSDSAWWWPENEKQYRYHRRQLRMQLAKQGKRVTKDGRIVAIKEHISLESLYVGGGQDARLLRSLLWQEIKRSSNRENHCHENKQHHGNGINVHNVC